MRTIILFVSILILTSCTKEIILDLNEAESKIVVDGFLSNIPSSNYIDLSKSASFYSDNASTPLSGANVLVTDDNGGQFIFTETSLGRYTSAGFVAQAYQNYYLQVIANEDTINASTYMPGNTLTDSLVTLENVGGFGGDGFSAFVYWTDEAIEKNYYRIRIFRNGEKQDNILVTLDDLFNGINTGIPLFGITYQLMDTAMVELMEIDQANYQYWLGLSQISDPQNLPAAPANPTSNLSDGALGYFGAYNISRDTVLVQ